MKVDTVQIHIFFRYSFCVSKLANQVKVLTFVRRFGERV
jgi:hypothetical protein